MAPRTRSVARLELLNTQGFPTLPIELLHHIVSYSESNEVSIPWFAYDIFSHNRGNTRRKLLGVLCRLCRFFRAALLPLYWESLEVHYFPSGAKRLVWLLEPTTTGRAYASYVKTVNIIELDPRKNSLHQLASIMALMPSLHTVQIEHSATIPRSYFSSAFMGRVYPSVKRLSLSPQARNILKCFPQVREVHTNDRRASFHDFGLFTRRLAQTCHMIECFGWTEGPWLESGQQGGFSSRASAVVKNLPYLRKVKRCLFPTYNVGEISQLSKLQNLEELTLVFDYHIYEGVQLAKKAIEAAREVVAKSSHPVKSLNLVFKSQRKFVSQEVVFAGPVLPPI